MRHRWCCWIQTGCLSLSSRLKYSSHSPFRLWGLYSKIVRISFLIGSWWHFFWHVLRKELERDCSSSSMKATGHLDKLSIVNLEDLPLSFAGWSGNLMLPTCRHHQSPSGQSSWQPSPKGGQRISSCLNWVVCCILQICPSRLQFLYHLPFGLAMLRNPCH